MGKHPGELISMLSKPNTLNMILKDVIDQCLRLPQLQEEIQDVILVTINATSGLATFCFKATFECVLSWNINSPIDESRNISCGQQLRQILESHLHCRSISLNIVVFHFQIFGA
ncbi:hypothetical protein L6164_002673 [Bauhinia variegata]|uniref:Uncharacterized protein n=1 Tax=Bauhinia variegata TaxID=167791 RepID=A0ACB9PY43_BAUVA|nr:hypothetical protein L6164_002673 [Bauhinia variegata]